ncbi:unnamed protein product [Nezara viridula]|uniref:Disks large-associated protein 5 n=1 Tax=Nezara viridula TaxID=85310 RepID=A0A9P0E7G0_NEZVI|nr:unnamed protein product [Nezara viridula]
MASSVFKMIHSEKRSKIRDMNDVRTRASKRLKESRKSQRDALLNLHRRVEIKPEVERKKTLQEETLLRLKSYREEKLKRMEEQKKSQKPPFYSLVRVRHTGGTPFKTKQQAIKNLAVTLPPATRSRTAFQKEFVFKATLNSIDQNGSKEKDVLPIKSTVIRSKRNNKENQQPAKNNLKITTKAAVGRAPLVKDAPPVVKRKPVIVPTTTSRSTRQKEIPAKTITTRPRRQREIKTDITNVAVSVVDSIQKQKNEVMKSKSDLISRTTVSVVKKGKEIKSKNSNSKEFKIEEEVNNLLADKLAERVFIMSPVITSDVLTRSTRRRPRPSTGDLMPSGIKTENVRVEKKRSENIETQKKSVDESGNIGPEALRAKLEEETSRLNSTADTWSKRHAEDCNSIPEHVKDEILAVVGQTRLLLSDKFQQFRTLIDNALSEHKESVVVIKDDDLLGFWEMMYLEVEQLNKKYENLASLAENGWCPLEKQKRVNKTKKRVNTKKAAASASSKFKEFLRKKKGEEACNEEFKNTTLSVPETPGKKTPSLMRTLNNELRSRRSSACNITLQNSFLAKAVLSPFVKS